VSWMNRLTNLFRRRDLNVEIDEELQYHLEARTRDNVAAGMPDDEARRDAVRRFGSRSGIREQTRDANVVVTLDTIGQDLVFAARSLRKHPGFTGVVLLTLALGIGANASIFTIVERVLLRPLPFPESDRLFMITNAPIGPRFWLYPGMSDRDYLAFREADRGFVSTATFASSAVTLTGAGDAVRLVTATVTPDFFRVLRVNPILGRSFAPEDDQQGRDRVALISEGLWRSRFGADPGLVNRTITLDGIAHAVIGIMPSGFSYPAKAELWSPLPIRYDPHMTLIRPVIARLRPDTTHAQAQAALQAFADHEPRESRDRDVWLTQVTPLKEAIGGDIGGPLLIFTGAVAFVLLIACANVANLLLMRGVTRRQEIATRLALGASRGRIIRQLLTESSLVSVMGGMAAWLVAVLGVPALLALIPAGRLPRDSEVQVDVWVFAFTLGLSILTGLILGLAPAIQGTRDDLTTALRESSGSSTTRSYRLRHGLVIAEVALALVLLVGAGLLVKSFLRLRSIDPGFRPGQVMTMTVSLPAARYSTAPEMNAFHDRLLASFATLPDVETAGAVNWLPLGGLLMRGDFQVDDGRKIPPNYLVTKPSISPDYFRSMGIRLLAGRDFTSRDDASNPRVVIVSDSVARAIWPNENAVGRRISMEDHPKSGDWLTIVGIVDDVRQNGLTHRVMPAIYQPYRQVRSPFFLNRMTFVVRTAGPPQTVAPAMRGVLRDVDPNQAPLSMATMEDVVGDTIAEPRFQSRLLGVFSILALLLAAIGIYGVLGASVTERRREIAIRMALGADNASVILLILRRTLILTGTGVLLGVIGGLGLTQFLTKMLFNVTPTDTMTFVSAATALVAVALAAGFLPARKAGTVDPLVALRIE
jgi:predicted permease